MIFASANLQRFSKMPVFGLYKKGVFSECNEAGISQYINSRLLCFSILLPGSWTNTCMLFEHPDTFGIISFLHEFFIVYLINFRHLCSYFMVSFYRIFMFSACCLFTIYATGQSSHTLRGQVIDGHTGIPLAGASVAAQNTTKGTVTDSSGFFTLLLPTGGYAISVSYTGYRPKDMIVTNQMLKEEVMITLELEAQTLDEVAVSFDLEVKDGWENYGQLFTDNFIGRTYYSKACVIKNPEVLHFYYYKNRQTLKVLAKEPLIVENFALGYNLAFKIDSFTNNFRTRTSMFVGYPVFKEMSGTSEQESLWVRNRFSIYFGSTLHFMRTLYEKRLTQEGYELKFILKSTKEEVPVNLKDTYGALNFTKDGSGTVHIKPPQEMVAVIYHRASPEVAYLINEPRANADFQISTFVFDPSTSISIEENGYYYPQTDVTTNGYLGFKKIADMLPYDYKPLRSFY